MAKTHYRNVFKSDHLGQADLEDLIEQNKPLIFTIKYVTQHQSVKVAGKNIAANIAHFTDANIKPLVLNATNSKIIKTFTNSSFVEDWKDVKIELYIDKNVTMKGSVVGGVRISEKQPKEKEKPIFTDANFEKAKAANATIEQIKKSYTITPEMELKYMAYVTA